MQQRLLQANLWVPPSAPAGVDNSGALRDYFAVMDPSAPAEGQSERVKKRRWEAEPKMKPADLPLRPLSSFPLRVPSAPAGGLTVGAGTGFDMSKGLASLLAIVRFMGTAPEMLEARQASGKTLTAKLASAQSYYHLRELTTWCISTAGTAQDDQRVLSDFCPGHFH
jgi:hypothetical protein